MKNKHIIIIFICTLSFMHSLDVFAEVGNNLSGNSIQVTQNSINISNNLTKSDDWIKTQTLKYSDSYLLGSEQDDSINNNEVSFAWNLTDFFSVNFNVFDNQLINDDFSVNNEISNINKIIIQSGFLDVNRNLTGYKLGVSSELGIGNNYKLGINVDYGQLNGANLIGFNSEDITTTSFEVGIRKSKFGASVNTDLYLEDKIEISNHSRLGIELDWYFSDKTTLSVGTKQRINGFSNSQTDSLDNVTGNVQYIKFQHNL